MTHLLALLIAGASSMFSIDQGKTPTARPAEAEPPGAISASNGICPGQGACCVANGTPGCDDPTCCEDVCFLDPICCDTEWDGTCVALARSACAPAACRLCPGAGDCCVSFGNGSASCNDQTCCEAVCKLDPFCCDNKWDDTCALKAVTACPGLCGDAPPDCPGEGDCCIDNGTPGCADDCCCQAVCESNPECCSTNWDASCAAIAAATCGIVCSAGHAACPGDGDCLVNNFSPGCSDELCCSLVCAADPFCCDSEWDGTCAQKAETLCDCGVAVNCPSEGDCCSANGTPGCTDASCCEAVCTLIDPSCCDVEWTARCATIAQSVCDPLGVCTNTACPGVGDCCTANFSAGCEDDACCGLICAMDPACCGLDGETWDSICAPMAQEFCTVCQPDNCPDAVVAWLDPADGFHDARQPHALNDATMQQGVEAFTVSVSNGPVDAKCFTICETTANTSRHPTISANDIATVSDNGGGAFAVTLLHPLTPGEVTELTYTSTSGNTVSTCSFSALPGDVNGDGTSAPSDILSVIDCLNGVAVIDCSLSATDVDRDGESGPSDILRVIDLLNGAAAFEGWFDATLPIACP